MHINTQMKKIIFLLLLNTLTVFSKDFDFHRVLGIEINMPKKQAFERLDIQNIKYQKGSRKYSQEYYTAYQRQNVMNAAVEEMEIGIKDDKVDFISFDVLDTDIRNFTEVLSHDADSKEVFEDVGYKMTKFYYDNCIVSFIFFTDEGKTSFVMITKPKEKKESK